jgi:hypothetical protein
MGGENPEIAVSGELLREEFNRFLPNFLRFLHLRRKFRHPDLP